MDESIIKSSEETILEITEAIIKTAKAVSKCEMCGNTFKKEITLKKHVNTKHIKQLCKVCKKGFKSLIEVLQPAAKEHSSNIKQNIPVNDKETTLEVEEGDQTKHIDIDKFKCMRCNEIVYKQDALKEYNGNRQNICSLCPILAYRKNLWAGPALGLHCTSWGEERGPPVNRVPSAKYRYIYI